MFPDFIVVCRSDRTPDGEKGEYVLATRRVFTSREVADHYAATINPSREPLVIRGRWFELRLATFT